MASPKPDYKETRKQRLKRQRAEEDEDEEDEKTYSEKYRGRAPKVTDPGAYAQLRTRTFSDMTQAEQATMQGLYGALCTCDKCVRFRAKGRGRK